MIDKWEIVIGCEIHTQLLTKTKAFCACENRYGGMPDTRVCPVCLGLPGAMPRISKGYVELGAVAGQALNCHIARFTKFDRNTIFILTLQKAIRLLSTIFLFVQTVMLTCLSEASRKMSSRAEQNAATRTLSAKTALLKLQEINTAAFV